MKTILVPTDFSPLSENALDVAADLARLYQAQIILLHLVQQEYLPLMVPEYSVGLADTLAADYEQARREAEESLWALAAHPKYAGVSILPKLGNNTEGFVKGITDESADLIILASKGVTGLQEWLEGSHAELIVRHASCPVLVIKQPVEQFKPKNIVCAVDLDDNLKKRHFYPFQLSEHGLRQFVYVLTPTDARTPEGIEDWMEEFAMSKGIGHYDLAIWPDKSVPEGIIHYASKVKADLIVLYTHGYKGLRHFINGSVAEDVLNHSEVPVLIMRV
ncbi:universal stress protein [Tellurirhabdus rosea]|uniref:universal stress protein n=1 Tax=Tellurirhabdus rosea TaxID=2674997 RepID=UPI00225A4103|nr:universal stress protein [Tellurirhabdus rosea]